MYVCLKVQMTVCKTGGLHVPHIHLQHQLVSREWQWQQELLGARHLCVFVCVCVRGVCVCVCVCVFVCCVLGCGQTHYYSRKRTVSTEVRIAF